VVSERSETYVIFADVLLLDIADLAWFPDDRYLASVGPDSIVIVSCGLSIRKSSHIADICLQCLMSVQNS
jgi:hypothetical protein